MSWNIHIFHLFCLSFELKLKKSIEITMTNFHFERCGGPDKATQSKQQQSDAKRTRQSASLLRGRTIISLSDMMRASSSSVSVFGVLPFHFNINNTHTRTHLCDNCTLLASGIQFQANYRQINDMVNSFYIRLLCTKRYVVFGCRYIYHRFQDRLVFFMTWDAHRMR